MIAWLEVITEWRNLEEYREMLEDALRAMVLAYQQQNKELPFGRVLLEPIPVEVEDGGKTP
ncbi:MAG: type II toxin-antitoxin system HicB family antitoxin [Deltaproteobacteria bacterium]|nr:type II toxin-antitoxin system HicB family antitoxin [Deltaproteobacteria bacterium]